MVRTITWIAGVLLLLPQMVLEQQKLAFVSGIERYQKSGLKNLDYAEDDANDPKTELTRFGFQVDAIIGDQATLKNLQAELSKFYVKTKGLSKFGRGDRLFFWSRSAVLH